MEKIRNQNLIDNYLSYLDEKTLLITPGVKRVLANVPKVTKKEMYEMSEPCDILVVYSPKKYRKAIKGRAWATINSTIQGSPYSSSKLLLDRDTISGYAVDLKTGKNILGTYDHQNYMRQVTDACLIRVPGLTQGQKNKIVKYLKTRKGNSYDDDSVLKTVWNRLFRRKIMPFFKDSIPPPATLAMIREPLICSTIISIAFKAAGVNINFSKNPYDVWPRDFLLNTDTQKLCRFEY